jgi:serine/threonine-protein kinase
MSPEQAKSPRDVDGRSDIYSVGVILYELLTGKTPFFSESGEFTEILFKLFTSEPPPVKSMRPDLPDELAAIVHKALAREPDDRFATPLEMADALAPFASEGSKHILSRMKAFKPPQADSIAPPEHLAPSMAAFSQLRRPAGQGTDVMAERPRIEVPRVPHFTEAMANAPGRVVASPTENEARALPEEAAARTQYPSTAPQKQKTQVMARAVQTDLGASRDTTQPAAEPRKPSAILFAAAIGVVLASGAIVGIAWSKKETKPPSTTAISATPSSETPASNFTPPPPPPKPPPPVSASASETASASAPASQATVGRPPPKVAPKPSAKFLPGQDNQMKE